MKTILKFIIILVVGAFLVISMIGIFSQEETARCSGMELEINDSLNMGLINKDEMKDILKKSKVAFMNIPVDEINLGAIEKKLSDNPYVDTVHASFNASDKLILEVIPRIPSLHIMANNSEQYYIDRKGNNMPIGNLNGNLAIATGNISKQFAKNKLAPLARCIQDSTFWRLQVQQIDVVNENDVRLYTRISDHVVLLGNLDSIPDKLHRLRIFYQQGLPKTGWNKYESINVAYRGIVIGTKKIKEKTPEN